MTALTLSDHQGFLMLMSTRGAAVFALAATTVLLAGCNTGSRSSAGSSASTRVSPSRPSSSTPALRVSYTKGQKVDVNTLLMRIKVAITTVGGTYTTKTVSSTGTGRAHIKYDGSRIEGVMTQRINGRQLKIIAMDGVAYISGTGLGSKPYLKVSKNSTGPLAASFKPFLHVAQGGGLTDTAQWTVVSSSPSGVVLTSSLSESLRVTESLNGKGLPVSTVTTGATGTQTVTYSDFGKPVTVTAPPASQVQDINGVKV